MRPNLYQSIHKAIRAMLSHLVSRASRTSFADPAQVAELSVEVHEIFDLLESHAHTENRFVHPLLSGTTLLAQLEHAHDEQEVIVAHLADLLEAAASGGADAPRLGHRFVLELSRYAADQLVHMADEEEHAMPAIWDAHDDDAILKAYDDLRASIPPAKMARYLRWMMPALDPEERAEVLHGMRLHAPPRAFTATVALCREVLDARQWDQLPAELRAS